MNQRNIAVGIDVGSTKIATTIGQMQENGIDLIGVGFAPSNGLRKGMVVDIEETVSSISASLEEAERMSGLPITEAVVSIGGVHIQSTSSKGVIAVSRQDGEISDNDTLRVLDAARAVSVPPNRQILHAIPRSYAIDGQTGIKDPVGMSGIRLEVDTQVISGAGTAIKNLTKCLSQAGVTVSDLVFTPLATARSLLSKRQREIGVALVDIGGGTTSFAVFEEGDILHAGVLPIGATHITNDIAIGLRTSIDTAEILKVKYGMATPDRVDPDEELDLRKIDKNEEGTANVRYISEIIEARLNEILIMVRDELRTVGRDGMLPAGIILTGGGAKQKGIVELSKNTLRLPAQVGEVSHDVAGMVDNLADPMYSASVGLMLWGLEAGNAVSASKRSSSLHIGPALGKAKNIFKNILP
ncbi:cell division protein FtsA [Patescibacteria group bacterium]|nr:cell division protein FtsA [Patescibacteria group bacterium]